MPTVSGFISVSPLLPVNRRRRPIGGASRQPVPDRLAVVIGLLSKGSPVVQTICVDNGTRARSGLADGANINPAALADQELGAARPKAVEFDQGPVCSADIN
jgi:hypothetical protein